MTLFRISLARSGAILVRSVMLGISNEPLCLPVFARGMRSRVAELTREVRGLPYYGRTVFLLAFK